MPDEIKPDDSFKEQRPSENGGTAINAVTDQAPRPAAMENESGSAAEIGEPTGERTFEENVESTPESESRPDLEEEFPDLSRVRMEETMASPAEFQQLGPSPQPSGSAGNIDLLLDVKMPISIELGRTEMPISEILTLGPGSVVELDKLAGEPVDLLVNDKIIAKGEVVVVDENFGVRITMLMSPEERLKSLA